MTSAISRGRVAIVAGGSVLLAAGIATFYRLDPAHHAFFPRCVFFLLTGLACPGCGATRAIHELLHGNLAGAFSLNPLLLLFYIPVLAFATGANLNRFIRDEALVDLKTGKHAGWATATLIVGFWIVRNTTIYPFP